MKRLVDTGGAVALAALLMAPAALWAQSSDESAKATEPAPLSASGQVVEQAALSDTAAQREKKICRTERVTGSLTRRSRICLTEREWARMAEGTRRSQDALDRDGNQTFAANPNAAIAGAPQVSSNPYGN